MDWLKDKAFKFQLIDLEVEEKFCIWKSWDKRNDDIKDSTGAIIQFPVKEGLLEGVDGEKRDFEEIKVLKGKVFRALYPGMSLTPSYERKIVKDGAIYVKAFKLTSNRKLEEVIQLMKDMGNDPLAKCFEVTYDKTKQPADMYGIKIVPGDVEKVDSSKVPESKGSEKEDETTKGFNDLEKSVVSAIKSLPAMSKDKAMLIMTKNGISEIRATEIIGISLPKLE